MTHFFPPINLDAIRCRSCGSPAVCVDPGDEPTISVATDIVVLPGRPASGTCWACVPRRRKQ